MQKAQEEYLKRSFISSKNGKNHQFLGAPIRIPDLWELRPLCFQQLGTRPQALSVMFTLAYPPPKQNLCYIPLPGVPEQGPHRSNDVTIVHRMIDVISLLSCFSAPFLFLTERTTLFRSKIFIECCRNSLSSGLKFRLGRARFQCCWSWSTHVTGVLPRLCLRPILHLVLPVASQILHWVG